MFNKLIRYYPIGIDITLANKNSKACYILIIYIYL